MMPTNPKQDGDYGAMVEGFREHLISLNRSPKTIQMYVENTQRFLKYIAKEKLEVKTVTADDIEDYQGKLIEKYPSLTTVAIYVRSVKAFYKWLLREKTVLQNPVELVPPPKFNRYPLRQSLTLKEITHLLNEPDTKTDGGILQKAVLECFYSSGIRLRELCRLKVDDVDTVKGVIRINKGKGGRDRIAIIGNAACLWIRAYRELVRPKLAKPEEENLFLGSKEGRPINPLIVGRFVKELARKAGIKGNVTPHSLRHACASQLLRNGASLVEVKDILGHELIESTKQYTRISISDLKAIHKQFHPRQ